MSNITTLHISDHGFILRLLTGDNVLLERHSADIMSPSTAKPTTEFPPLRACIFDVDGLLTRKISTPKPTPVFCTGTANQTIRGA